MGRNYNGNILNGIKFVKTSEYNFYSDIEAAHIVLRHAMIKMSPYRRFVFPQFKVKKRRRNSHSQLL